MTTQQTLQTEEYKQTELGELPKSWEVVKVKDVSEKLKAGGTPSRGKKEYWNDDIPFVLIEDMTATRLYLIQTKEKITKKGLENSSAWIVPENSILLSMYATIGSTAINKIKLATNQAILAIIPKNNFDVLYGAYILRFNAERLKSYNIATTQKNVNKGIVENFEIPLPPLPEQQNIAYVLSTVQNAQEKTENYINSLKELKKSAMKHLFTYGAVSFEDIDKVELKETEIGMMPKSWGVGKFEDIVIPQEKIEISSDSFVSFEHIQSGTGKLLGQASAKKFKTKTPFKKGTLLYGRIRPYLNKVWIAEFNGYCTNDIIRLNAKNSDINFVKYILLSDSFVNYATSKSQGTKMPRVKWEAMKVYPLSIPPLPIQQNIASILSAIDEKIQTEEQKKEALKETFNSLLRDLMTAKIRVNNLKISNNTNTKR